MDEYDTLSSPLSPCIFTLRLIKVPRPQPLSGQTFWDGTRSHGLLSQDSQTLNFSCIFVPEAVSSPTPRLGFILLAGSPHSVPNKTKCYVSPRSTLAASLCSLGRRPASDPVKHRYSQKNAEAEGSKQRCQGHCLDTERATRIGQEKRTSCMSTTRGLYKRPRR